MYTYNSLIFLYVSIYMYSGCGYTDADTSRRVPSGERSTCLLNGVTVLVYDH